MSDEASSSSAAAAAPAEAGASGAAVPVDVVRIGASIMVSLNGEGHRVVRLLDEKQVIKIGKVICKGKDLLGHPLDSLFDVDKSGRLARVPYTELEEAEFDEEKDNRDLVDDMSAQKLSYKEIEELKQQGVTGEELIKRITENSATFEKKTAFSQQKYLKKKQKKHLKRFRVQKPTTLLIAQMLYERGPMKICNLRFDSLAQLLLRANVHAGARVLVNETCLGLVSGAIFDRMRGHGLLMHVHGGPNAPQGQLDAYNFTAAEKDIYHTLPLKIVRERDEDLADAQRQIDELQPILETLRRGEEVQGADAKKKDLAWVERRIASLQKRIQTTNEFKPRSFDSLVIATRNRPLPTVMSLLPYLEASRPFAVFFVTREPLLELFQALRSVGVIGIEVLELFTREHQVLEKRTHPVMVTDVASGFILSGTTTADCYEKIDKYIKYRINGLDAADAPDASEPGTKKAKVDGDEAAPEGGEAAEEDGDVEMKDEDRED